MDIHAALMAHVKEQNEKRTKWVGDLFGVKEMYATERCPADEKRLTKAGVKSPLNGGELSVYMAAMIIAKAQDANGKPIFMMARDLPVMELVADETIAEIYLELFKDQGPETSEQFEERVKN